MGKEKLGMVLEGGALRGLFTSGVLDVLMENGIVADMVTGVSAGAAFGCNYKSAQPGRVLRYNLRFCKDPRYCSIRSLLKTGDLFGADFCYKEIPEKLDPFDGKTFTASPMEFYLVATDIERGRAVYHLCRDSSPETMDWIRASASMPFFSRPVRIGGLSLLDGGITSPIPLSFMQHKGCEKTIVVLTRPRGYAKKKSTIPAPMRLKLRKYPRLLKAMENQWRLYNAQRDNVFRQEAEGKIFVICPERDLPIRRITHDPKKIQETCDLGRKAALERLAELREYIGEH